MVIVSVQLEVDRSRIEQEMDLAKTGDTVVILAPRYLNRRLGSERDCERAARSTS